MKKSGVTQLNVRVPEFIAERLRILAALSGETQAELVILALQDYLDKHNDLIRNFLALQQRFAGGRAHSDGKDTGSPSQVAGQTAKAEEAQGSVPAESAQVPQDSEQGHMHQVASVPNDSEQAAGVPQADMQPVADATMAPVHAQEVQELTCMAGRDRQDAGQDTFHAGPVPGTQNTAQDSEQGQASQQEEAAGTESTGQEETDKPGPSVEDLRARARELKAQGLNQSQIARAIGKSEASVRRYLKAEA